MAGGLARSKRKRQLATGRSTGQDRHVRDRRSFRIVTRRSSSPGTVQRTKSSAAKRRPEPSIWREQPIGLAIQLVLLRPPSARVQDMVRRRLRTGTWRCLVGCSTVRTVKWLPAPSTRAFRGKRGATRSRRHPCIAAVFRRRAKVAGHDRSAAKVANGVPAATRCRGAAGTSSASRSRHGGSGTTPT